jgi:hypothetical protein
LRFKITIPPPELLGYPVNPDPVTDIDFRSVKSVRKVCLRVEDPEVR